MGDLLYGLLVGAFFALMFGLAALYEHRVTDREAFAPGAPPPELAPRRGPSGTR
jgi:hypothetical protein